MSTTPRDLIRGALKLIGVVAAGENPSAQEQTDALSSLNDMLDIWSTESLLVYSKTIETFPLTSGQQTYTMGVGGNFNTSRPIRIFHAATLDQSNSPANEIPIAMLNLDQWADVTQKLTTSTLATKVYVDFSNPLLKLYFWPVPTISNSVVIYSWKPLSEFTTVNSTVDLPPGYQMAIKYNLALILAPEYGRPVDPAVAAIANSTLASIQRANIQPLYMECDPAIISPGKTWDWRTGE
jgi:hypothetical protein